MDEKSLGRLLQEARRKAGLTQQELCHAANLSYSTLAKIERGAIRAPSIFTIQSIATALHTSLDTLLGSPASGLTGHQRQRTRSGASFLYFDVNGCLVRFWQRASARIAEDNGVPADVVEMAYLHLNDEACRGNLTMADLNAALAERLGLPAVDWAHYYLEAAESLLGMHDLITWASKHYRVGLLTNIMPGLLNGLMELGKVPKLPYDVVIDSSKVGTVKPEPQIFQIATEQAGVPPEQILLIDDTQANLVAAEKQGWHVLLFDYSRPEESTGHIRDALEPAD